MYYEEYTIEDYIYEKHSNGISSKELSLIFDISESEIEDIILQKLYENGEEYNEYDKE